MKINPVGAELFHVSRWADRHVQPNGHSSQFCKRA